ncbi:hypothetical protein EON66_10890, partial [archaeon]
MRYADSMLAAVLRRTCGAPFSPNASVPSPASLQHECFQELKLADKSDKTYILQPGSTVATSLAQGEVCACARLQSARALARQPARAVDARLHATRMPSCQVLVVVVGLCMQSATKCTFLVEVKGTDFRVMPQPLKHVRPFIIDDVCLALGTGIAASEPDADIRVAAFLQDKVCLHAAASLCTRVRARLRRSASAKLSLRAVSRSTASCAVPK